MVKVFEFNWLRPGTKACYVLDKSALHITSHTAAQQCAQNKSAGSVLTPLASIAQWGAPALATSHPSLSLRCWLCVYINFTLSAVFDCKRCVCQLFNQCAHTIRARNEGREGCHCQQCRARALDWFYLSLILLNRRRRRQQLSRRERRCARHKNLSAQFKDEQLFCCVDSQNKRIAGRERAPQESDGITSNSRHHARAAT